MDVTGWGQDGWAVVPGEGRRVQTGGPHWLEVLLRGADTGGAIGAFVFHHDVIVENPPHAHGSFAKIAFVLEGEYEFRVGDAVFAGPPGSLVYVPQGSQHTFTTASGGRMLFVSVPAGNEELFLEMGQLGPDASADDLAALNKRFNTYGLPGDSGRPWRLMHGELLEKGDFATTSRPGALGAPCPAVPRSRPAGGRRESRPRRARPGRP
jgi:quercetin dioxygenase-like cupin family protein